MTKCTPRNLPLFLGNATAALLLGVAVSLFFLGLLIGAFSDGLCCADDAFFAQVAKNVAFRGEYATAASEDTILSPALSPFDPAISSGPVIILSAALLIRIFGNHTWVPGLTTILLVFVIGSGLFLLHWHRERLWQASAYLLTFGTIAYATTAQPLTPWHSLFGEIPAALLSVFGVSLACLGSRRGSLAGTLVMGLAIQAKLLALLVCGPAMIWIALSVWRQSGMRAACYAAGQTMAVFLLPECLFLIWQLLSLGVEDFLHLQIATLRLTMEYAGMTGSDEGILSRVAVHAAQFEQLRGYSLSMLTAGAIVSGLAIWRYGTPVAWRRSALLFAGSALHLLWWVAISNGSPRYAIIGLVVYSAGIAATVQVRHTMLGLGFAAVLLIIPVSVANQTDQLMQLLRSGTFDGSERIQHLLAAAKALEHLQAERPFVTGYWAPMVELEYLLPESGDFIPHLNLPREVASRSFILAYNKKWLQWVWQPGFAELDRRCVEVFSADPYYIKRCPPQPARVPPPP
jgi:hypothetical protein